jgi:hypothetical protein
VDEAGNALEAALKDIGEIEELAMEIDDDSVLQPLREGLRTIRQRRAPV